LLIKYIDARIPKPARITRAQEFGGGAATGGAVTQAMPIR
jgi:hypothetical protein